MKKTKVIFFQHILTSYNFDFYNILKKNNNYLIDYYFDNDPKNFRSKLNGLKTRMINIQWNSNSVDRPIELYLSPKLLFDIINIKPSIVLSEDGGNFINNLLILLLKPLIGFKLVLWGLGDIPGRKLSFYKKLALPLIRKIWKNADAIISYSTYGKNIYEINGVESYKIFVANNSMYYGDVESRIAYYKKMNTDKTINKRNIIYVGMLEPRKRVEDLIESIKIINSKGVNNYNFYIIGSGSLEKKITEVIEYNQLTNCIMVGFKNEFDVSEYFSFADVCVVPGEGGLVVNHALRHGVPVIVSMADGTELDLVTEGENGCLFKRGDVEDLANKIITILDSPKYYLNAQKNVEKIPTIESMANKFLSAFNFVENN